MRKILGTVFLLIVAGTSDTVGQERGSFGFYGGANISEFIEEIRPSKIRFGINYSRKLFGPIELYPGLDLIPESLGSGSMWQANIHLRVWPLRRGSKPSFWFVGAGVVVRSSETRKAVMTGFAVPSGRYRPFVQAQLHGPLPDGELEVIAGFFLSLH